MSDHGSRDNGQSGFFGKKGMTVRVWNGNVNGAISQLKKRMNTEGVTKEFRSHQFFETNTAKRRKRLAEAKSRWKKKQAQIEGIARPKKKRPPTAPKS